MRQCVCVLGAGWRERLREAGSPKSGGFAGPQAVLPRAGWRACAGSLETLPQTRTPGTVGRLGLKGDPPSPYLREKDEVSVMARASASGF